MECLRPRDTYFRLSGAPELQHQTHDGDMEDSARGLENSIHESLAQQLVGSSTCSASFTQTRATWLANSLLLAVWLSSQLRTRLRQRSLQLRLLHLGEAGQASASLMKVHPASGDFGCGGPILSHAVITWSASSKIPLREAFVSASSSAYLSRAFAEAQISRPSSAAATPSARDFLAAARCSV